MPILRTSPARDMDLGTPHISSLLPFLEFPFAPVEGSPAEELPYWNRVKDEKPLSRYHWIQWLALSLKRRAAKTAPIKKPTAMVNFFISYHFFIHS